MKPYKNEDLTMEQISNYNFNSLDKEYNVTESRKVNPYFHSYKFSTCFVGGSSSGKTTSMIRFFDLGIYNPDKIVYIAPIETLDSNLVHNFITKYHVSSVELKPSIDYDQLYEQLNIFHQQNKELTKIFIFDDFQAYSKNRRFNNFLSTLLSNASRFNANMILLCQTLNSIDTKISSNINVWALFCSYLPESQIKVVLFNRANIDMNVKQAKELISRIRKSNNKHIPLIVNSNAPKGKQLIYENYSLDFVDDISDDVD